MVDLCQEPVRGGGRLVARLSQERQRLPQGLGRQHLEGNCSRETDRHGGQVRHPVRVARRGAAQRGPGAFDGVGGTGSVHDARFYGIQEDRGVVGQIQLPVTGCRSRCNSSFGVEHRFGQRRLAADDCQSGSHVGSTSGEVGMVARGQLKRGARQAGQAHVEPLLQEAGEVRQ